MLKFQTRAYKRGGRLFASDRHRLTTGSEHRPKVGADEVPKVGYFVLGYLKCFGTCPFGAKKPAPCR